MTKTRIISCPVCSKSVATEPRDVYFPFCSDTCKNIDLGRWLDQRYAVDIATGALGVIEDDADVEEVDLGEDDLH